MIGILAVCAWCAALGIGCSALDTSPKPATQALPPLPGQATGVLTTAHESFGAAVNDFFARRPEPVQPIEFPHNTHVSQGLTCTEYCHESVTKGPVAGLPSVKTCMICHEAIATDRPRIQQITALRDKGLDLNWQRVYGYPAQSHVKFNHAPHVRANVDCATCHGNIGGGTVAQVNVKLSMGFCVNCHNEKKAPVDCLTCHF
ncbi:MAG: cytochrome c3 family protein [Vicinamibacterales bacterium]